MPTFVVLQDQYEADGFSVIGIAVRDTAEKVREYASDEELNFPLLMADDKVGKDYGNVSGNPDDFCHRQARDGALYLRGEPTRSPRVPAACRGAVDGVSIGSGDGLKNQIVIRRLANKTHDNSDFNFIDFVQLRVSLR